MTKEERKKQLEIARQIRIETGRLGGSKPGTITKKTKEKRDLRNELKAEYEKIFGEITQAGFSRAKGYYIVVARKWEYNPKTKERHRTGEWYQVSKESELLELMNGMDDGEDDCYYKVFLTPPSMDAIKYYTDQMIGKAPEKIKVEHEFSLGDILEDIQNRNQGILAERTPNPLPIIDVVPENKLSE
jgi:hypothetical protein